MPGLDIFNLWLATLTRWSLQMQTATICETLRSVFAFTEGRGSSLELHNPGHLASGRNLRFCRMQSSNPCSRSWEPKLIFATLCWIWPPNQPLSGTLHQTLRSLPSLFSSLSVPCARVSVASRLTGTMLDLQAALLPVVTRWFSKQFMEMLRFPVTNPRLTKLNKWREDESSIHIKRKRFGGGGLGPRTEWSLAFPFPNICHSLSEAESTSEECELAGEENNHLPPGRCFEMMPTS